MYIVTGANGGIGTEITRKLLQKGGDVIMACRNMQKATPIFEKLKSEFPAADLRLWPLDLANLSSIEEFADRVKTEGVQIEALINNAGVMSKCYAETADGFEMTMGVNFVGVYALTRKLLPSLSTGSCVLNTVSVTTSLGSVKKDFLAKGPKHYFRLARYSDSKLALLLFTIELEKRLRERGIRVCGIDPGVVDTGMISMQRWFDPITDAIFRPFIKRPEKAAEVTMRALESGLSGRIFRGEKNVAFPKSALNHKMLPEIWSQTEKILEKKITF